MTPTLGALHGKGTRGTRQGQRIRPHDLAPRDRIAVLESRVARLAARYGTLLDAEGSWTMRYQIPSIQDPAADLVEPDPSCAEEGCGRPQRHWGLCSHHYGQVKRKRANRVSA